MLKGALPRLQQALRERIEAVDRVVHAPLRSPTRANYRCWLCSLYKFIAAFETSFALTPMLNVRFTRARMKAGYLAADLLTLGLDQAERARLANRCVVPTFTHPVEALGWLFVVDRITLQLEQLRDNLLPALQLEVDAAGAFFNIYDGDVITSWIALAHMLDRWIDDERAMDTAIAAARAALECLESCAAEVEPQSVVVDSVHAQPT